MILESGTCRLKKGNALDCFVFLPRFQPIDDRKKWGNCRGYVPLRFPVKHAFCFRRTNWKPLSFPSILKYHRGWRFCPVPSFSPPSTASLPRQRRSWYRRAEVLLHASSSGACRKSVLLYPTRSIVHCDHSRKCMYFNMFLLALVVILGGMGGRLFQVFSGTRALMCHDTLHVWILPMEDQ